MKIGIATLVCSSHRTAPDTRMPQALEMLSEAGFDCVEYNDQSLPQYFRASDEELKPVREKAAALGIRLHSAHSPCGDYDLTSLDGAKYAEALEVHLRSVRALAKLGVGCFVVHQMGGPRAEWPRRFDRAVEAVARLCGEAGVRGMKILIENFTGYGCRELRKIIAAVDSSALGICFDVGHAHLSGLPMGEEIEISGDRLWSLHVHDNHGKEDEHLPPGMGTVDWPSVVAALRRIRYAGPFLMEIIRETPVLQQMSPLETVRESYRAAKKILNEA